MFPSVSRRFLRLNRGSRSSNPRRFRGPNHRHSSRSRFPHLRSRSNRRRQHPNPGSRGSRHRQRQRPRNRDNNRRSPPGADSQSRRLLQRLPPRPRAPILPPPHRNGKRRNGSDNGFSCSSVLSPERTFLRGYPLRQLAGPFCDPKAELELVLGFHRNGRGRRYGLPLRITGVPSPRQGLPRSPARW